MVTVKLYHTARNMSINNLDVIRLFFLLKK
nr:MAG TPA: hypothetical protein [Caudoviricetes sp.]